MAKGNIISPETKQVIATVYRQHRNWMAKQIQVEVNKRTQGRAPGISAIQKILSEVRNKEAGEGFILQDSKWHLGTLELYQIPNEAIPTLIKIQKMSEGYLTVRQAKWIARLHAVYKDIVLLVLAALSYSVFEEGCELTGTPCDTSKLDALLAEKNGGEKVFHEINRQFMKDDEARHWWDTLATRAVKETKRPDKYK